MQVSIPWFPVPRGGFPMLIRQILSLKYTVIKRMNSSNVAQSEGGAETYTVKVILMVTIRGAPKGKIRFPQIEVSLIGRSFLRSFLQ